MKAFDAAPAGPRPAMAPPAPRIQRPVLRTVTGLSPATRERALVPAAKTGAIVVRRRGGRLVTLGNLWVLHRKGVLRVLAAMAVAGVLVMAYVLRDDISAGVGAAADLATAQMARAGLGIERIEIEGLALTREADVARALGIEAGAISLNFDIAAARLRVEDIPSVASATIRKVYPDTLVVSITERVPVARWRVDGATMLIDAAGAPIAPAGIDNGDLILVIGEGAADDALPMITMINRYPDLSFDLAAINRVADRRWDLIFYSGLRVLLPETGVVSALNRLNAYQLEHQLLERDLDMIDMRVPQYVAVRPTVREDNS